MKKVQYISLGIALLIGAVIYFKGNIVSPKNKEIVHAPVEHDHEHEMPPMMANIPPVNFDSLEQALTLKLHPAVAASINDWQEKAKASSSDSFKSYALEQVALKWREAKYPGVAAFYFAKSGKLENSEKKLNFASHLFFESIRTEENPNVRIWMAGEAVKVYETILEKDPNNDEARMEMALVYIEGSGEVMKGIQELLYLNKKDTANFEVGMILGKMAVESGQYDKAIERGKQILNSHPESWQARIFMAEAYKRSNQIEEAKSILEEAKRIKDDPAFSKDVDAFINTF